MEPQIVVTEDTVQLIQITDTHLFGDGERCLLSVNTGLSFQAVVEDIVMKDLSFDAIVATGDISQDHTTASYARFADGIERLIKPCYWLPGNHDQKSTMSSVLPSEQIHEVGHVLAGDYWQLIMLDSQVEGLPHGYLEQQQLQLLEQKLNQYPERHTLVMLHHNSLPIGSAWLDQHKLQKAHQLWEVLDRHQNVRAVLGGHVHQDFAKEHNGVQVIATPSTCIQFKANTDEFALDTLPPGWRYLQLHKDGHLSSTLYRLAEGCFVPDFDAQGY
ncbi:3',5'-cyclic-AMP phosphodiesterase [Vibrio sp. UCD-FRSSP16_10]|uniref:3',5'-cyclic-AMP phosphodiesterase n=1 Tax=unclassified Vibrio TaxID=2614977 RepID=UPI0007FE89B1|nr:MULTISPECIES: 3',5'-cyclic-AMP phosphodiesterase [unclassified Vibrio]OBT07365.1 3',5'-cyclic-AMP phosphodiesterase [Vibrio sp. UCD-FRSSP16_30]OBT12844.1 3',5'-cyclic-AMP phosphodiesterase [Vibrio sp. UCD-FRSSP16_10]